MERWVGKVAVVTGASAGIGRSIAEKLVTAGVITVGISRRLDRLEELKEELKAERGTFHPKKCDITNESQLIACFKEIKEELGPIYILVNNAGKIANGKVCEQKTDVVRNIFETNVIALCVATREAVTMMREHNIKGHIVHINSVVGHNVIVLDEPEQAAYPATKHAVTALTEILRQEMNYYKTGIKVTSISPGLTNTEIFANEDTKSFEGEMAALDAENVADAVMYTLSTPPKVQVLELIIKAVGEKF